MAVLSDDVRSRYSTLLSNNEQVFNRLTSSINHVESKFMNLIGFSLTTLSLELTLVTILFSINFETSQLSNFIIGGSIAFFVFSIAFSIRNFYPKKYSELQLFDEERLKSICISEMTRKISSGKVSIIASMDVSFHKQPLSYNWFKWSTVLKDIFKGQVKSIRAVSPCVVFSNPYAILSLTKVVCCECLAVNEVDVG